MTKRAPRPDRRRTDPKPPSLRELGWSQPTRRPVPGDSRRYYLGMTHLLVLETATDRVRARCGLQCDTLSPPTPSPATADRRDICTRCAAPYAVHKRRRSLKPGTRSTPDA